MTNEGQAFAGNHMFNHDRTQTHEFKPSINRIDRTAEPFRGTSRQFLHAIWSDHYSQRGVIGRRLRDAALKSRGLLRENASATCARR
jgi:hypothetical protein